MKEFKFLNQTINPLINLIKWFILRIKVKRWLISLIPFVDTKPIRFSFSFLSSNAFFNDNSDHKIKQWMIKTRQTLSIEENT